MPCRTAYSHKRNPRGIKGSMNHRTFGLSLVHWVPVGLTVADSTFPVDGKVGLKRGRRATRHNQDIASPNPEAFSWYTDRTSVGETHVYTEEPASFSPFEEKRVPSPGLPESPTLPAVEGQSPALSQQSLPAPLVRPVWKNSGSISLQS